MSRGVSRGRTSLAAMARPYCLEMASPRASTHITVGAVWSTADTYMPTHTHCATQLTNIQVRLCAYTRCLIPACFVKLCKLSIGGHVRNSIPARARLHCTALHLAVLHSPYMQVIQPVLLILTEHFEVFGQQQVATRSLRRLNSALPAAPAELLHRHSFWIAQETGSSSVSFDKGSHRQRRRHTLPAV